MFIRGDENDEKYMLHLISNVILIIVILIPVKWDILHCLWWLFSSVARKKMLFLHTTDLFIFVCSHIPC